MSKNLNAFFSGHTTLQLQNSNTERVLLADNGYIIQPLVSTNAGSCFWSAGATDINNRRPQTSDLELKMQEHFSNFNARFDRWPFLFYSLLVFSFLLNCGTSFGQSSDIAAKIEMLTNKINQHGNDANLFLERAKLYLELSEQQRSEEFTSEWAFPIVRAGVEANALAIQDSSSAIERDPEFADAYFLRAWIRMRHPDSMDYGKWSFMSKHFDSGPYQEYGESPSPENARSTLRDLILPDLNAGLKLQPDSKQGQDHRWSVLRVLGKGDQVLNEVNQTLKKSDITQERRTELLRIRLSIFKLETIGDGDQANEDEAAIKVYEEAMSREESKKSAEFFIIQLTDRLGSVDLSSNERAELLSSRAELYRRLNQAENAEKDDLEARSLRENESRDAIARHTVKLATDDLPIEERIATLTARAGDLKYIGDHDNAMRDSLEAEKLSFELARVTYEPLIEKVSRQIEENSSNARLEHQLLKRRANFYDMTNQKELAEADRYLAKRIRDDGYRSNSRLIGGGGK